MGPDEVIIGILKKGLDDIAKGMVGKEMPSLDTTPLEFQSAMWSWSQKHATEILREVASVEEMIEEDRREKQLADGQFGVGA